MTIDNTLKKRVLKFKKIYPSIITKISSSTSPKPSKAEKENRWKNRKTGFVRVKAI
ncbi:MAG: hypothetical protein MGG37_07930 [Trichodesmium sp. MAG_R01]|nr:hypothetical protein [Trichodesmium sp. MAG_R01]